MEDMICEQGIGFKSKKASTEADHLHLAYTFDEYRAEAEAGDFDVHTGWTRTNALINFLATYTDIHGDTYNVIEVPGSNTSGNLKLINERTDSDFQNMHDYGEVFGGTLVLDIVDGELGCFTAIETTNGTDVKDEFGHPVFNVNKQRLAAFFRHDNTNVNIQGIGGTAGVIFNGLDTVTVVDWKGDTVTNTVPEIVPGEFFKYEFHVRDGLTSTIFLYINGILVGNPTFSTASTVTGTHIYYATGSSDSTNRHTYIRNFGATINTGPSELVVTKAELESVDSAVLVIPNGTRNYSLLLDKDLKLHIGFFYDILSQAKGTLTWSANDDPGHPIGLKGTIDGFSSNVVELDGVRKITRFNVLDNGARFIYIDERDEVEEIIPRISSKLNLYLPESSYPYTTSTIIAGTSLKVIISNFTDAKLVKDFTLDTVNGRWFLDDPEALDRWFTVNITGSFDDNQNNTNHEYEFLVYKNGVIEQGIEAYLFNTPMPNQFLINGVMKMSNSDYFDFYIKSIGITSDVIINRLSISINELS